MTSFIHYSNILTYQSICLIKTPSVVDLPTLKWLIIGLYNWERSSFPGGRGWTLFNEIQSALWLQLKLQLHLGCQTNVLCSACCVLECQKTRLVPPAEATAEKYPVEVMPGPTSFSSWSTKVLMIFHAFQSHQSSWLLYSGKPIHINCTVNHQCSHLLFNIMLR